VTGRNASAVEENIARTQTVIEGDGVRVTRKRVADVIVLAGRDAGREIETIGTIAERNRSAGVRTNEVADNRNIVRIYCANTRTPSSVLPEMMFGPPNASGHCEGRPRMTQGNVTSA